MKTSKLLTKWVYRYLPIPCYNKILEKSIVATSVVSNKAMNKNLTFMLS